MNAPIFSDGPREYYGSSASRVSRASSGDGIRAIAPGNTDRYGSGISEPGGADDATNYALYESGPDAYEYRRTNIAPKGKPPVYDYVYRKGSNASEFFRDAKPKAGRRAKRAVEAPEVRRESVSDVKAFELATDAYDRIDRAYRSLPRGLRANYLRGLSVSAREGYLAYVEARALGRLEK